MTMASQTEKRLQKHLADLGVESRRTIERWIEQGKIKVNGKVAKLGDKVNAHSRITVDGNLLRPNPAPRRQRVILYNKPEGEISTRKDPDNRPTVYQKLPKLMGERWVSVGRLDINTSGLLLFTNDGELANCLMHPRFGLEREYLCRVYGRVDGSAIQRLQDGIMLDRTRVKFQRVQRQVSKDNNQRDRQGDGKRGDKSDGNARNNWYSVVVSEGKYREVRRMWEAVGCRLSRLLRVRYGDVILPKTLKTGQWMELKPAAVSGLMQSGQPTTEQKPPHQERKVQKHETQEPKVKGRKALKNKFQERKSPRRKIQKPETQKHKIQKRKINVSINKKKPPARHP